MEILNIDHLEFYVGNALQSSHFYCNLFGFKKIAYMGPETGKKDTVSYVLSQGSIKLVLTAPLVPQHRITYHLSQHGDFVRSLAFEVDDAIESWRNAVQSGAVSFQSPLSQENEDGRYVSSAVIFNGDLEHRFVERKNYRGVFSPQYVKLDEQKKDEPPPIGLLDIDHCTINLEKGKLEEWINFYKQAFYFQEFLSFDDKDIHTDYSALMTKVVANEKLTVKLPLIQPIDKKWKSQIQEFVDYNGGLGVQHLAVTTNDIIKTISRLKRKGIEFLKISDEYYQAVSNKLKVSNEDLLVMQSLDIMVDEENDGLIYQAFTKPLVDRPAFFLEVIERKGAISFGKNNVQEFFKALTAEQSKRGNL